MSIISGLAKNDIQKHTIIKLLDIFGIDIDPNDGRIYFSEDPSITLQLNNKVLCVDLGKKHINKDYSAFNPLTREDHAQFLMQLAVYARIFSGDLTEEDIPEADYTIKSLQMLQDQHGIYYQIPMMSVNITDTNDQICGTSLHEDINIAVTIAVLDYLWKSNFIKESIYKEMVVLIEKSYEEYIRIQELNAAKRKQELWQKNDIFRGRVDLDESESFYEGEIMEEPKYEWGDEANIVFTDADFQKEDKDGWIHDDLTEEDLTTLFGWKPTYESKSETPEISEENITEDGGEEFLDVDAVVYEDPSDKHTSPQSTIQFVEIESSPPQLQDNYFRSQLQPPLLLRSGNDVTSFTPYERNIPYQVYNPYANPHSQLQRTEREVIEESAANSIWNINPLTGEPFRK